MAALSVGAAMAVGSLIEVLHIANKQQGAGFAASAGLLRALAAGEIVVLILLVLLLRAVGRRHLTTLAGLTLVVGLIDVILTAQAGVIP